MTFDEKNASPEALRDYYMGKYRNPNPIARWLTNGFYRSLGNILSTLPDSDRVLEIGCGPGESTRRIQTMLGGRHFEASEYEQRLVDLNLAEGFPVPLRQESAYELQRPDNAFQCVLMLEVLEHLDDVETALAELFRVAETSVVVSVPNEPLWRILNFARGKYWSALGNTPGHINHWSPSAFRKLIGRHGRIVSVHKPLPWTIIHARPQSARASD